ncbi:MAG TPA: alcohol dehydrogenase catalytic domain-containing protein [Thermoanaerobaculia bacterium]|jgi:L-iditol 2-dehydrogenase|nr:alcohol dehydrogenase catalytic domain-containing protein [Thermoanaerobaculia bacterium]
MDNESGRPLAGLPLCHYDSAAMGAAVITRMTSTTSRTGTIVAACTGGGSVRLETRPVPQPGPGEIRLRLRQAGLCGTDLYKLSHGTAAPGTVLGHEVVGTVEVVGQGVAESGIAPGDRVVVPHHVACGECTLCRRGSETLCPVFRESLLTPGGFSEHILVGARAVRLATFVLPEHLSDEAAVFLEPAACVLRGIRHSRLPEIAELAAADESPAVAVLGAGSMGLLHLLVLKALFPSVRVAVVDPLEDRRNLALHLGADAAAAPGQAMDQAQDVVFDTVGGPGPLEAALTLSREGGTAVLFAHSSEGSGGRAAFDLNRFFKSERKLVATYSGSLAEQREIWHLLVEHRLDPRPLITHHLPLSRCAEAVDLARQRQALKVLLAPDPEPA